MTLVDRTARKTMLVAAALLGAVMIAGSLSAQQPAAEPALAQEPHPADQAAADLPTPLPIADHPAGELLAEFSWNDRSCQETWELIGGGWEWKEHEGETLLSLARKEGTHQPPFRSPLHLALLNEPVEGPFALDVEVRSTHPDYGHRDVCLFLGYQNPAQFYYVHLAKRTDEHANQIFRVDQADRLAISARTTAGTAWDDAWHWVRVARDPEAGNIEVWFDDLNQPVMEASDTTFAAAGRIGVGSFDDTAVFRKVRIWRTAAPPGQ